MLTGSCEAVLSILGLISVKNDDSALSCVDAHLLSGRVQRQFRMGLVVNPLAGIGGPAAHKGSDDAVIRAQAREGQLPLTAAQRGRVFLENLRVPADCDLVIITVAGAMGAHLLRSANRAELIAYQPAAETSGADTQQVVRELVERRLDLLVFVGGDGTARDVCRALPPLQPALGVPAGVKMHSGVYAINPVAAAEWVSSLLAGELVNLSPREVRDIDEEAFRRGVVRSHFFGEMLTPVVGHFVQHVKQGGLEVEELVLLDIAEHLRADFTEDTLVIMGPGSTTWTIQKNWGLDGTLLGVDLLRGGVLLARDVDANTLEHYLAQHVGPVVLIVTVIGGQGHIIGRGNQQLTPDILRRIGRDHLRIVATKTKLKTLAGRPLVMDSGDPDLDRSWQGYIPVITGYQDTVLYPLGFFANAQEEQFDGK